jgi:flagellar hook-associated protein 2
MASADIIGALGAGSGVDVKALAQSLVDVEKMPREEAINTKINDQERRIAGYSALMLSLETVKTAFQKLNDLNDFNAGTVNNSAPTVVGAVTTSAAVPGRHTIEVMQLAAAQRDASNAFTSKTAELNGGASFNLTLTIGGTAQTPVSVDTATPQGVVDAINAANQGVSAQIIDAGYTDPVTGGVVAAFKILLTGPTGESGAFSYSSSVAGLDLAADPLASASNATVKVDGLTVTRSSNAVDDVIPGVYLDLLSTNAGSPADIRVTRDTASIKENLQAVVKAYNDAVNDIGILTGARSEDPEDIYSGSLKGDSTVRLIKTRLREMFVGDSSTPGATLTAFRDLGLDLDRTGVMSLNETSLDSALANNFDDVVTLFSAGTNNQSEFGTASRGIAGDAVKAINDLISSRGTIMTQSEGSQTRIDEYKVKLEALNTRMEALLLRYTKQFGIMETMVGQSNALRESLTATFDGMMAMYTKK